MRIDGPSRFFPSDHMPISLYLDTNVFDHLIKGPAYIAPDIAAALFSAIDTGLVEVPTSIYNVEELLGEAQKDPRAAVERLSLLKRVTRFNNFLKPVDQLSKESFEAYAQVKPDPIPCIEDQHLRQKLTELLEPDGLNLEELEPVLADTRQQVVDYREGMQHNLEEIRRQYPEPPIPTFESWYQMGAPQLAEIFAEAKGVKEACLKRGLDGLVKVPYVGAIVGFYLSVIYEYGFHKGLKVSQGDSRDVLHATSAANSYAIVSFDDKFLRRLTRMPVRPKVVSKDELKKFLDDLK